MGERRHEHGLDSITLTLTDDPSNATQALDSCTIHVRVTAVNDPVLGVPGDTVHLTQLTDDLGSYVATAVNELEVDDEEVLPLPGVLVRDVDLRSPATISMALSCSHGALSIDTPEEAGVVSTVGDGTADREMQFVGQLAVVNAAVASLSYRGELNFSGSDSVVVAVDDGNNAGSGGAKTDTETIPVLVRATNDPPVISVPTWNDDTKVQRVREEAEFRLIDTSYAPELRKLQAQQQTGYELFWSEVLAPHHDSLDIGQFGESFSLTDDYVCGGSGS